MSFFLRVFIFVSFILAILITGIATNHESLDDVPYHLVHWVAVGLLALMIICLFLYYLGRRAESVVVEEEFPVDNTEILDKKLEEMRERIMYRDLRGAEAAYRALRVLFLNHDFSSEEKNREYSRKILECYGEMQALKNSL